MVKKELIASWLALMILTLALWFLRGYHTDWLMFVVLIIIAIKGQLIIDRFMELRRAPILWRLGLSSWLVTVLGVVGFVRATTGT